MLKLLAVKAQKTTGGIKRKIARRMTVMSMAIAAMAMSAVPSFAANADLDTITGDLVTGAGDMKTNALLIIGVVITIIIVVFGISWLINIFKKKMSKA